MFNADEESGSTGSGELIAALAEPQDVVLSCEPTDAKDVVKSEGVGTSFIAHGAAGVS